MEKYVLITGASTGLGKKTAETLAEEGFRVFAGVRKQEDKEAVEALNPNITGIFLDVTNEESINCAFEQIEKITDSLYALVNNAGVAIAGPVEYIPIDMLRKQFEINVFGAIRVAQKALPFMKKESDARIVNISSMASYGVFPFVSPYCVSKRALDMFFNSLCVEAKMPNLKVISIKPGVVLTPIWKKSVDECEKNRMLLCDEAKEKYGREFDFLLANAKKNTERGLLPKDIAKFVLKALKSKKPKLSYNAGTDSILARIMSYLPQNILNMLIVKGLEKRVGSKK